MAVAQELGGYYKFAIFVKIVGFWTVLIKNSIQITAIIESKAQ